MVTDIALHAHSGVNWISWRTRDGFGRIHLTHYGTETLCHVAIPHVGRVVRDQESATIEDLCRQCLKQYAIGAHE